MSDFQWNEGKGGLFHNRKQKDTQPDYRGEVTLEGNVYEIAGWKKEGKRGTWLSLSVNPKGDYQNAASSSANAGTQPPKAEQPPFNDEIPF